MNAPATDLSRRGFLTRLFSDRPGRTGLSPLDDLRQHTDGVLWAALAVSGKEQYVAGDDGMVFRRTGSAWVREEFPSTLPIHALCSAGNKVYSAGWLGLICERVEGSWRAVQGGESSPDRRNLPLFDIAADSNDQLWAVGDQGRVTHFDGTAWTEIDCDCNANLRAVLPLADERVLVAGSGGTVRLLSQGQWQPIATGTGCNIVSMAALADDSVIALGGEYDVEDGHFRGRIFLYQNGQWQSVASEQPLPRLRRIRRCGDALLICGDEGTAFRWDGEGVRRLQSGVRFDLHDLLCSGSGEALICGDGGTLLRETESHTGDPEEIHHPTSHWQQISSGECNRTLRGIWSVGDGQLIAAGDGGTILHIDGESITRREAPDQLRIHSLWGSSPRHVYAACDNATILHFDGEQWRIAHRGHLETALLAITGFGPHDIFAVGDNGYCLRYDGLMWRQLETGARQELYALWGQDSQHLLAVGGGGVVLRFDSERWKTFSSGTDHDLYAVCGSGLDKLYLCGLSGTMVRFEHNAWHRDFTGVRSDLHALAYRDGVFYAAGSSGTILRNDNGQWELEDQATGVTLQAIEASGSGIYTCGSGGVVLRRQIS